MSLIKQALEKAEEETGKTRSGTSSDPPEPQRIPSSTEERPDRRSFLNALLLSLVVFVSSFLIGLEVVYLVQAYWYG